ncbi:MAG TPA: Fe-S cluster assembly protein SufB [Candidatus Nanoarchaeia archaeon]|nr:Fe-S cluster assembly protein SufB [Candidatus Nanoarchaeia archaeon]
MGDDKMHQGVIGSEAQTIEINRDYIDHKNIPKFTTTTGEGISEATVRAISAEKNEPEWMLNKRLKALELFNSTKIPVWGPDLSKLDLNKIIYYAKPDAKENANRWEDLPADIRRTFEKLGIPEAERKALAGAGTQYESTVVYHKLKEEWEKLGVIFENCDVALQKHPDLFKKYFMTNCVPISDHKFAMLHAAVWSGGTFIYIPPGVKVTAPLQAYFRMNAPGLGQFEHTLIIADKGAEVNYIEGCFTKGAIITSNPDYKPIEEIKIGDKVLTHKGRYKSVYHIQKRPYSGNIYRIEIYGDSTGKIEVTEEHPFISVKRDKPREQNKRWETKWRKPAELNQKDYLAIPRNKVIDSYEHRTFTVRNRKKIVSRKVGLTNEFFRLIGYYLAEGSIMNDSYLSFSFGSHEREYINDVEQCLTKVFGITKWNEIVHKKNHGISIVVGSVELARIFKEFGTSCSTKSIPQWAMLESPEKQGELIIGLFRGDGSYSKQMHASGFKEAFRLNTTSLQIARQVREILLRLGIASFLNRRVRAKPRLPIYTVGITGFQMQKLGEILGVKTENTLNDKRRASMFFVDEDYMYVPIKKITKRRVSNIPVYNFSVRDDESYVACGVAVHNCSAPKYDKNNLHAGCVEIYVHEGARVRYNSVENWSKNTYNLNTKRAVVDKDGTIEWINGNLGSQVTMLYPCSILKGTGAKSDFLGVAFASKDQNQDTGAKIIHLASNTTSTTRSKSISKDGGITTFRGLLKIAKDAQHCKANVNCDALMLDAESKSDTIPFMEIKNSTADIAHEATVGKISAEQLFYLMSRGMSEEQAMQMVVSGFIEPIVKELPLEYAIELNKLIQMEMEGSLG